MTQQVTLTYKDDKTLNLLIPDEHLAAVIEDLKKETPYFYLFNEEAQIGVWSCRDEIRHVIVQPFVEVKADESKGEDQPSIEVIQGGDEDSDYGS